RTRALQQVDVENLAIVQHRKVHRFIETLLQLAHVILRDLLQVATEVGSVLEELEAKLVTMPVGCALDISTFTERVQQTKCTALVERNPLGNFAKLELFAVLKNFEDVERFYHCFHYIFV